MFGTFFVALGKTEKPLQPSALTRAKMAWRKMSAERKEVIRARARERWPILGRLPADGPIVVNQCVRLVAEDEDLHGRPLFHSV